MADTEAQPREERGIQGTSEVEFSDGEEGHLEKVTKCTKNPGHKSFIPVDQFNVSHLPLGCHNDHIVDLVKAMSNLTVRVSVEIVRGRESIPISDTSYQGDGSKRGGFGTGWLWKVIKYNEDSNGDNTRDCEKSVASPTSNTCICAECLNSPTPQTQFAHILIQTAKHLIKDIAGGDKITCHLFFNNGANPRFCTGVVTLTGMSSVENDVDRDFSVMTYVTHDLDLINTIDTMIYHCYRTRIMLENKYRRRISNKYKQPQPAGESAPDPWDSLTIIVSHPHGCSKQVSVGRYVVRDKSQDGMIQYAYNAPTCPGSSGAHVFMCVKGLLGVYNSPVHSGGHSENYQQENFSSEGNIVF